MKAKKTPKKSKEVKTGISKEMTFAEVMEKDKNAAMKLSEKGMMCCGCPMAMMETIEQGCMAHGINPDELVDELNKKNKAR